MKEDNEHKLPFELIVGDETGEIMNGDVPVRWCVTPALVKELEVNKVTDPHVLLVTADERGREMQRQMVPMTELMTYVRFTKSGSMKLYGFILDGSAGRKMLHNAYMRKQGGGYKTEVIYAYYGTPYDDLLFEFTRTEVTVEIPEGVFGKEPSPWMKWFVNLWHSNSGRVVDECHYRRRLILAFTLKWIPVLLWTGFLISGRVLCTGGLILAGYWKGVKFLRSFRPYKYPDIGYNLLDGVDIDIESSQFLIKRKSVSYGGYEDKQTMLITLAIVPLTLVVQTILAAGLATVNPAGSFLAIMVAFSLAIFAVTAVWDILVYFVEWLQRTTIFEAMRSKAYDKIDGVIVFFEEKSLWKYIKWGLAILLFIPILYFSIMFEVVGIVALPILVVAALYKFGEPLMDRFNMVYTVTPEKNDYTEIRELLCPKDELNLKPDIRYIPPKQRTVRLWYLDLKNKVCKPMQR